MSAFTTRARLAVGATTIALCVGALTEVRAGEIRVIDYSESGHALMIERLGAAEYSVQIRPAHRHDVLEFTVANAAGKGPLTFHVHNAPGDATPEYTEGEFLWRPVEQIAHGDEDVLIVRQSFARDHAVVRLQRPPLPPQNVEYYNLERLEEHLASIEADPYVTVEVIGWSYQNRPEIDRPIYKVTLNDPSVPDEEKRPVLILCRQHGNEFGANHIVEAMMDFIRGAYRPELRPPDLLERMRFTIYPMINPDGVEASAWGQRHNRNGKDLNRVWNEAGSGPGEEWEVRHVHSDIEAFQQHSFYDLSADMHGWRREYDGGFRFGLNEPPGSVPANYYNNQQTFFEMQVEINPLRPVEGFLENGATVGMARYCMYRRFNTDIHTSETADQERTRDSLLEEGPLHVLSFYRYLLNVHFIDADRRPAEHYTLDNDRIFILVEDYDQNKDPNVIERLTVTLRSPDTGDKETLELIETGPDTGVFWSEEGMVLTSMPFRTAMIGDGLLQAAPGERLRVDYEDPDFPQGHSWDFASARASPLVLGPVTPGRAGEVNTISARGAEPGERVAFVYALQPGLTPVGMCPGLTLPLGGPALVGIAVADANGEASVSSFVPALARGRRALVQPIGIDTCTAGNVGAARFE